MKTTFKTSPMKKLLLTLSMALIVILSNAQSYNPLVKEGTVSPAPMLPVEFHGTGLLSFGVGNSGSTPLHLQLNQEMVLIISLSDGTPNNVDPIAALGGTWLDKFDWTYNSDPLIRTYTGTQNQEIPGFDAGDPEASYGTITIDYAVFRNTPTQAGTISNGFNVNLSPPDYTNGFNTTNDDAVSSYTYVEAFDYGDAPISYGEAVHEINVSGASVNYIYLGTSVDPESSYQASSDALGDDSNDTDGDTTSGENDENGVTFPLLTPGATVIIPVSATIESGSFAFLNAWIDWTGDGDFDDAGEQITSGPGSFIASTGTTSLSVTVPLDATTVPTFARFRIGNPVGSSGPDTFGEVEDYQITIAATCINPPTVVLGSSSGSTCGLTVKTVTGNTFGGSATSIVSITENGAGSVSPTLVGSSPFDFTYTPATGDFGNTVIITVTTDNPLGAPCEAATATYSLTVYPVTPDQTIELDTCIEAEAGTVTETLTNTFGCE